MCGHYQYIKCSFSCRKAYGSLAGWQSSKSWWKGHETYAGMVEVSRALMKVTISHRSIAPSTSLCIHGIPIAAMQCSPSFPGQQLLAQHDSMCYMYTPYVRVIWPLGWMKLLAEFC